MDLSSVCSPSISRFIESRFGRFNVNEKKATCHDCLCSHKKVDGLPLYRKDLKCCTFHPYLPNYEVGAILETPEISESIKSILHKKINTRSYSLPLGIFVPVNYQVNFNNRQPHEFGNREDFLCPYFDRNQNQCGLWAYRGSVCTSYFCTSDRGEAGLEFWSKLGDYLHHCEMVLAQYSMVAVGLPGELIDGQLEYINCETATAEEMATESMSASLYELFWNDWDGSVVDFYRSCYKYINQMSLPDLESILIGETVEMEEDLKISIAKAFRLDCK